MSLIIKSISYDAASRVISADQKLFDEFIAPTIIKDDTAFFKLTKPSYVDYFGDKLFSNAKKDEDTGRYTEDGQEFESITGDVIPTFQNYPFVSDKTVGERAAENL